MKYYLSGDWLKGCEDREAHFRQDDAKHTLWYIYTMERLVRLRGYRCIQKLFIVERK